MHRHDFLRGLCGIGAIGVAGCLGSRSRDGLAVEGTAPTLAPGADGEIVAVAYEADQVAFTGTITDPIEIVEVDVSPSPDSQLDSFPPIWLWNEPQSSVEATARVSVPADADVGEYAYGVSASVGERSIDATFTVTVDDP